MILKRKMALPLALALGALGLMVVAQMASATHPRPKGATPLRVSLAVAYVACPNSAPPANKQHGAPLAALSCNPPVQTSNFLTVGTGDAWINTFPKSIGSVRLDVKPTSLEDVKIVANITDVRCKGGNTVPGFCANANTDNANVPDYSGELEGTAILRITDHFNGPIPATQPGCGPVAVGGNGAACPDPATVSDLNDPTSPQPNVPANKGLAFPFPMTCTPNVPTEPVGSTCGVITTANAVLLLPGSVQDNSRANVEIQTVNIQDGGSDGTASTTAGNTLFETQGIFIP